MKHHIHENGWTVILDDFDFATATQDDINQIVWHEVTTPIAISIIQAKKDELQEIENQRFENAEASKASALAKLSALGLTEEEVKAIL